MKKVVLSLILLSLTACTTPQVKSLRHDNFPQCFVKWDNEDSKIMYVTQVGRTNAQRKKDSELITKRRNNGVIVHSKLGSYYSVSFDMTQPSSPDSKNTTGDTIGEQIQQAMILDTPRITSEKELAKLIDGLEKVDCKQYFHSQN